MKPIISILLLSFASSISSQVLLPLHPHPITIEKHQHRQVKQIKEGAFQNSIVYEHLKLQRNSPRDKRFLKLVRKARAEYWQSLKNRKLKNVLRRMVSPLPLFQGLGSHYVTAYVGTPPQRTTLLVDTGSSITGFPVTECGSSCGKEHTDQYFDPSKSATFKQLECNECQRGSCGSNRCTVGASYLEGSSWSGYEAKDSFYLGPFDGPQNKAHKDLQSSFTFACQTEETGLFEAQLENGILGLIDSALHLPKILSEAGLIPFNQFSLCFGWELTASADGIHSGLMTLGGVDTSHHKYPVVYAKKYTSHGGYEVKVHKLYLKRVDSQEITEVSANYDQISPVIVDSGTTVTFLDPILADGFYKEWKSITGFDYPAEDEKRRMTEKEVDSLPSILIQLEGVESGKSCQNTEGLVGNLDENHCNDVLVTVPPRHYLFDYGDSNYSFELHFQHQAGGGIIGANSMQMHDVFFDNENSQIGFAESDCNYSTSSSVLKKSNE